MIVTIPFWIALILSLVLVPLARNISLRLGFVDAPKSDRWHSKPTPKVGGIAIFIAFVISISSTIFITKSYELQWALLVGSVITFIVGVTDDNISLSPAAKIVGQIIAAAIVVFFGRNLDFFELEILNIIFTFGWLVGITNAINLLDNMDGLAGGIALIASLMLSLMFWQVQALDLLLIALALGGAILGFLFFNFPPASVFMGDSGSLFLGFTLASLAIAKVPRASNLLAILGVPTLIFLLPILDTTMVTITRVLRGQSPTIGGKDHTSHRLIAFGLSERQTVIVLYGVAFIAGMMGSFLESIDYNISLLLIPIFLLVFTLLTAYLARIKVVKSDAQAQSSTFSRLILGLTGRGRVLEIVLDSVIICVTYYFAFWIYYGTSYDILSLDIFLSSLPIVIASAYISFFAFGIYRRIWQYIGLKDLLRFSLAVVGSALINTAVILTLYPTFEYPWNILFLYCGFLFFGLAASRVSFRLLDQIYIQKNRNNKISIPVVIYVADDAGVMALNWLVNHPSTRYDVIGFLDDDPYKLGRQIQGINVLGNLNDLSAIIEKYDFQGIVFPSKDVVRIFKESDAFDICQDRGIWLKLFQINFEAIE
jgi:UDP-GlcNAc:undecaprenyl-phosphate GlcNAc-1-phosphate transferase